MVQPIVIFIKKHILPFLLATLTLLLLLASCSKSPGGKQNGDLSELMARKSIRIIVRPEAIAFLPRSAYPVAFDREIAEDFSNELDLELSFVVADDYAEMINKLLNGEGDVIAAGMSITKSRKQNVAFSSPYLYVDELVITKQGKGIPKTIADLAGKAICVRKASSHFEALAGSKNRLKGLMVEEVPGSIDAEDILDRVASGECAATIMDSNYWEVVSPNHEDLAAAFLLSKAVPIALAVRPESKKLRQKLNEFLVSRDLTGQLDQRFTGDLDGLKERKVIRMITRNNAMTYFIYRGTQLGFEYELIKRFAKKNGLRLEVVVPPRHEDLVKWLNEGRGDVIAAAMTITKERSKDVAFSAPYNYLKEVIVVRNDNDKIKGPQDLSGKTIYIRRSSSFYPTLMDLKKTVKGIRIALVSEDIETEDILKGIEDGIWDITVSDSNLLEVEQSYGRELKAAFSLNEVKLGWAVRKANKNLKGALDTFVKEEYRGLFYNMMKDRYFKNKKTIGKAHDEFRYDISGKISPYDDLIKKYAGKYGMDWRLIAAQIYQESKFDPDTVSWAGAVGLMQIMPRTAKELGVGDMLKPEASIQGGTKYLGQMLNRFDAKISTKDRIYFALAAYNVGYGHVTDARRLAARMSWSPDEWFDNVEKAMLLLQKPQYYKKARYGYSRGVEPVKYVRGIQNRYNAYVKAVSK